MSLFVLALFGCGSLDAYGPAQPDRLRDDVLGRDRDPIGAILERAAELPPELRTNKLCRMSAGPFPFYRATAHVYYDDLYEAPERAAFAGPVTWLSGDAHPHNFGTFDDDEGTIVFDLNDFDESFVGDAQLDLWRLSAGAALLASAIGLDDDDALDGLEHIVDGWLDAIADHADGDSERSFQMTEDEAWGRLDDFIDEVTDDNDREHMLDRWALDGVFHPDKSGLEPVPAELQTALEEAWPGYVGTLDTGLAGQPEWFRIKDVAYRVGAGLGSLGTPRLAVLIEGETDDDDDDRILDVKAQGDPAVWPHLDAGSRGITGIEPAARVVTAHAALLNEADDHLGTLDLDGLSWSVRERSPYKETLGNEWIDSKKRFRKVAEQWGYVLGTAHSRGDVDSGRGVLEDFDTTMLEHLGDDVDAFRTRVVEVGAGYAEVVRSDHRRFVEIVGCPE